MIAICPNPYRDSGCELSQKIDALLKGAFEIRPVQEHVDRDREKGGDRGRDQQIQVKKDHQGCEKHEREELEDGNKDTVLPDSFQCRALLFQENGYLNIL